MFDGLVGAGVIEKMRTGRLLGFDPESVGDELRAVVGQALVDAERCGLDQGLQECLGGAGGTIALQRHIDPVGGAVDRDEQELAGFAGDDQEVLEVEMDEARHIGFGELGFPGGGGRRA